MKEEQKVFFNISNYHDTVSAYKRDKKYFICITDRDDHWGEIGITEEFFNAIQKEFGAKSNKTKKKKK